MDHPYVLGNNFGRVINDRKEERGKERGGKRGGERKSRRNHPDINFREVMEEDMEEWNAEEEVSEVRKICKQEDEESRMNPWG